MLLISLLMGYRDNSEVVIDTQEVFWFFQIRQIKLNNVPHTED